MPNICLTSLIYISLVYCVLLCTELCDLSTGLWGRRHLSLFQQEKTELRRLGILVKATLVPSSRQIQGPELQIHAFYSFARDWKENTDDTLLGMQPCEHMIYLIFLLVYSWFTMLRQFQAYSKVNQLYIYIFPLSLFFLRFSFPYWPLQTVE